MAKFYIPTTSAEQWAQLLAEPTKQWRQGYSARTLAYCWQEADGFPAEVRTVLQACEPFQTIELLLGIPEHQVPLPGGSRPTQSDIWCLAKAGQELVSIAIEGKVAEPFGPTLGEWLAGGSPGKSTRLGFLQNQLSLSAEPAHEIRYQLLHRSASAIIEAKRFGARHAIMLVHSFSPANDWFPDFDAFARMLGVSPKPNRVFPTGIRGGVDFYVGWVSGNQQYLTR
ncbi:MAG: hypothetical protein WCA32_03430 [Chromatiaceae bacterium]|jgi:hypothetical protein